MNLRILAMGEAKTAKISNLKIFCIIILLIHHLSRQNVQSLLIFASCIGSILKRKKEKKLHPNMGELHESAVNKVHTIID